MGADLNDVLLGRARVEREELCSPVQPEPSKVPPALPDRFWAARECLDGIRAYARAQTTAPDAVLIQAIVRAAVVAPPSATAQTCDYGDPSPLSLYGLVIAPSGAGKSSSARASRRLVPADGDEPPMDVPIGSGEGLAEVYIGEDPTADGKRAARVQVRHRVHVHVDEAEAMVRLVGRQGATLGETLRRGFTGEPLGQRNGTAERTRVVRGYRLGLTVCATPGALIGLLQHAELGLPQRFLWTSAIDPGAPRHPRPAAVPVLPIAAGGVIRFDAGIQHEIQAERWRALRGESTLAELDSHQTLIRCRVAAVLAAWERRVLVSDDDWTLAGWLLDTSRAVRAWTIDAAAEQRAAVEAEEAERRGRVAQTVKAMAGGTDAAVQRLAQRIARRVHRDGVVAKRDLSRGCTVTADRHLLQAAIDHAVLVGWIIAAADGAYTPGSARPA